ncbi:siderophore-interacting protein [Xanthomonas sp. NCPPB 2654]|uniref:siderophore-interacting protein n=1 Tax=unclassified Xanthomonas TaxID=2643310 RepID=UPI0021E01EFD|nr:MULTISPECIES: siderophore-interacting protein [unclassified Xanthomonas]MDL5365621.1 siderophore-interacting protein [Xanthomonas sp. NCPPB 2654]UYC22780.1 siderophore-interacting protein [Xanthomonas sp. CFBP 8443]
MSAQNPDVAVPGPGRIGRALLRMFMKQASVVQAESLAENFRLITLESPAFRELQWLPGQKIQIAMGSALVARTYTPIEWDAVAGRTRIVAYTHGSGPGSAWIDRAKPGDACDAFGPRASLDLGRIAGPCVVLGDETSIGLAYALNRRIGGRSEVACLLEVAHEAAARAVLDRLDLGDAELFSRCADDRHLKDMERRLQVVAATDATFVLTGRAPSIQRLRRTLKGLGVPASRIIAKAYWAEGKTGLD